MARDIDPDSVHAIHLITGATGYVGGRLLKALRERGYTVRCLARDPAGLAHARSPGVEILTGDLLDPETLPAALEGIHTAFYLVHSMDSPGDFEKNDRRAAINFGEAAYKAGVKRIIYLGGLGDSRRISDHLLSRQEVGDILRESGVPVIEFRASIIIGAGSTSFEMIRAIAERVPIFFTAKWATTECQPIYIGDVIAYLTAKLSMVSVDSKIYEIGAADTSTYLELIQHYARLRRLPRLTLPFTIVNSRFSSMTLPLLTPGHYRTGMALIEGLRTKTVVQDDRALDVFKIKPLATLKAIELALLAEDIELASISWSKRLVAFGKEPVGGFRFGNRYVDTHRTTVSCPPEYAMHPIIRVGGKVGWYAANKLWWLRGIFDRLIGGPGMRYMKTCDGEPKHGDIIDCFTVDVYEQGHRLRLKTDMRTPGRAWLDFEVIPIVNGSQIRITAIFDPKGLMGVLYWYITFPFHRYIFRGILKEVSIQAEFEWEKEKTHAPARV